MNIYINGSVYSLSEDMEHTVAYALEIFFGDQQTQTTFAVALNGSFVGKQSYHNTSIKPDDSLDVLFPIVGG